MMSRRGAVAMGVTALAISMVIGVAGCSGPSGFLPNGTISIDRAQESVQSFLNRTGDQDLKIDELMEFEDNFYALIKEKRTGIGAFELLVDKRTGAVGLEPGPNMMWNTKYSMMAGGMMGPGRFTVAPGASPMTVTADRATQLAQAWLERDLAGASSGTADRFYGYYTFHFENDGKIAGMLSVNGYSGQVWFHSWHGTFIQARDFGG